MHNSLSDPFLISQYHQEYLTLINYYDNFRRPGTFVRYYNIDYAESDKHPEIKSTFDLYSLSNIKFNIYELTPTYNISPIMNSTTFLPDKKGQTYDGVSSITLHTIKVPRIHDLVTFYDPIRSGEIFRVSNIRTSINAYYSNPSLNWYEMELEVAPIKDTSSLKISKHYIYDLHKEKYYNYEDYKAKKDFIETVNGKISEVRQYYSKTRDYYLADNLVPFVSNHAINYFKEITSKDDNHVRVFNQLEKPYGFSDQFPDLAPYYNHNTQNIEVYNLLTEEIEEYEWDRNEDSNLNNLLSLTSDLYNLINNNLKYF